MIPAAWFEYESGHPWCESAYKYQTHPYIAEFANTVTNLPIILLPLINAALLWKYAGNINASILIPNLLLSLNGCASTYYHATISLFGQLVDELSLLWMVNMFAVAYAPISNYYPEKYKDKMQLFRGGIIVCALIMTVLCFVEPSLNAIFLMMYTIPSVKVITYEVQSRDIPEIAWFPRRILVFWGSAVVFWVADRLLCDVWLFLGIPYLHAIFHLFSSLAGYWTFLMFSVIDIEARAADHNFSVAIRYFPTGKKPAWYSQPYLSIMSKDSAE